MISLPRRAATIAVIVTVTAMVLTACSSNGSQTAPAGSAPVGSAPAQITLVTYDSFPQSGTSLNDAIAAFTERTGITVEILSAGDTGTMISKAVLTSGNPEGDVLWGVDQTSLTQALAADVFAPVSALAGREALRPDLMAAATTEQNAGDLVVPVNFGDVCINYDITWYAERSIPAPTHLSDLTDPLYAGQLVELADAKDFFREPAHPYSKLLMASVPRLHQEETPVFIPGQPPSLLDPPTGCRFAERCPSRFGRCDRDPDTFRIGERRTVRCWLHAEGVRT
jgi:oligopeptide/dipeptide ABC transporter ATP-binding protein